MPSKITLKNYASDTKRFIRWYEEIYKRPFPPSVLTKEMIKAYLDPIATASPRSAKRYASSLRKFFEYLVSEGTITYNPLVLQKKAPIETDAWRIRDFGNHLYNLKKNPVTIKNYISDIKQFTNWAEETELSNQDNPFAKISTLLIEDYKNRLLTDVMLSPLSVNRKLSSLRQYLSWASGKGLLKKEVELPESIITTGEKPTLKNSDTNTPPTKSDLLTLSQAAHDTRLPAEALPGRQAGSAKAGDTPKSDYSGFPPLRLLQKTGKGFGFLFDLIFVLSFIKTIETIKFNLWKATGRQVFAPIPEVMKSLQTTAGIAGAPVDMPAPKTPVPQALSAIDRFMKMKDKVALGRIRGLPKSTYAPDKLSTASMPLWKKTLHHIRHTRPYWYKKYHSYSFVHYVHFGIVLIVAVLLGLRIYQPFMVPHETAVLASRIGPTREIAFQGHLADRDGLPITRDQKIRFAIYKSKTASGSALLWEEVQAVNPDPTGTFTVSLGANKPINEAVFSENPALYLGVSIGMEPELKPREELANYLLSANSKTLQGLKPITGNNAGTENVILALDSSGNLTIGDNANPIFQATGGKFSLRGNQLILSTNPGSDGNIILNPDGAGIIDIQKPIQNTSEDITDDLASGAVKIDDNLAVSATSSAQSALVINQNDIGGLISATTGGVAKFTVSNSGTATIGEDLVVLGNNLSTVTGTFRIADTITKHIYIGGKAEEIFLGGAAGTTTVNHNLKVLDEITAEKGLNLPYLEPGAIPFLSDKDELTGDVKNLFWDTKNKRLGLGTSLPVNKLTVLDNTAASNRAAGSITNANTTDSVSNVALRLNLGVASTGTQARFMTFYADCKTADCAGSAKGNIAVTASGVAYNSGSADFAEYFKKKNRYEKFEEGDLVCHARTAGVEKCTNGSNGILGVYSKDAGFIGAGIYENNPDYILVGLIGQLRVKVSKESDRIEPGDPIGSSKTEASASKALKPGQIVGRALEPFDPQNSQNNLVRIALNVSWYDPQAILMNNGTLATAYENTQSADQQNEADTNRPDNKAGESLAGSIQNFLDTLGTGVLKVKKISVEGADIATENITIGTETLREYITRIVNEVLDERQAAAEQNEPEKIVIINPVVESTPAPSVLPTSTPTLSPTLTLSPSPQVPSQTASDSATVINITNIYNNTSSPSAQTASPSAHPEPEISSTPDISPTPLASVSSTPTFLQESTTPLRPSGYEGQACTTNFLDSDTCEKPSSLDTPDTLDTPAIDTPALDASKVATFSAELYYVPNLTASLGRFDNGLISLGPTSLTEATVSTQISIGENMKLSGTSIDTIGSDLNLQPLRQGNLSLMGGLITIDTKGNLRVEGNAEFAGNVEVRGALTAGIISPLAGADSVKISGDIEASGSGKFVNVSANSLKIVRGAQADTSFTQTVASASAGTAVITTNETERTILTPFVTENSLIYITPVTDTKGIAPYIARQTPHIEKDRQGSFTIQIPTPQSFDIKMNWIIVN